MTSWGLCCSEVGIGGLLILVFMFSLIPTCRYCTGDFNENYPYHLTFSLLVGPISINQSAVNTIFTPHYSINWIGSCIVLALYMYQLWSSLTNVHAVMQVDVCWHLLVLVLSRESLHDDEATYINIVIGQKCVGYDSLDCIHVVLVWTTLWCVHS